MANSSEHPELPQPPQLRRRLRVTAYQAVGASLILLIPVFALFGVFGVSKDNDVLRGENLDVTLDHTTRTRFGVGDEIRVQVTNRGDSTLEGVEVRFESDYLDKHDDLSFTPSAQEVTAGWYVVELGNLDAGESQAVIAEYTTASRWRINGEIVIAAGEDELLSDQISNFIYP